MEKHENESSINPEKIDEDTVHETESVHKTKNETKERQELYVVHIEIHGKRIWIESEKDINRAKNIAEKFLREGIDCSICKGHHGVTVVSVEEEGILPRYIHREGEKPQHFSRKGAKT